MRIKKFIEKVDNILQLNPIVIFTNARKENEDIIDGLLKICEKTKISLYANQDLPDKLKKFRRIPLTNERSLYFKSWENFSNVLNYFFLNPIFDTSEADISARKFILELMRYLYDDKRWKFDLSDFYSMIIQNDLNHLQNITGVEIDDSKITACKKVLVKFKNMYSQGTDRVFNASEIVISSAIKSTPSIIYITVNEEDAVSVLQAYVLFTLSIGYDCSIFSDCKALLDAFDNIRPCAKRIYKEYFDSSLFK